MPAETPFDGKDFATISRDLLQSLAAASGRPLTDDNEGSVVRTLSEAFAHELAVCYQQLRQVYRHGFLDTAEGVALDHVVALLGMQRQRAGHLEGLVTFRRPQAAAADIPVPSGTLISGRDAPLCATVEDAVLATGATEVTVRVRSLEPGERALAAGALNLMPRPIWGVATVENGADLLLRQSGENDNELRQRARRLLPETRLGTPAAIEQAVRAIGIASVKVREDADNKPGQFEVVLGDHDISDELFKQAETAVDAVRTAGIRHSVVRSQRVVVEVAGTLVLRNDLANSPQQAIHERIQRELQTFFDQLNSGEPVRLSKIGAILSLPEEVAELRPSHTGGDYLRPFVKHDGQWMDESAKRTLSNGDIAIGIHERAALDLTTRPLKLQLVPPLREVRVGVHLNVALDARTKQTWRSWLQTQFDFFTPPRRVSWSDLIAALPPGGSEMLKEFTLKHQGSGDTIALNKEGDADQLGPDETLLVDEIVDPGGGHG